MGDRLGIPGAVGIFVYFAVGYVGTIAFSQQKIAFEEVLVYSPLFLFISDLNFVANCYR